MRNFGDKTEGDSERPRDNGFVGVLLRSTDNVRPVAQPSVPVAAAAATLVPKLVACRLG